MRKLTKLALTLSAALALSTGIALAHPRTLGVLISVQGPIKHGLKWQVLGSGGKELGSATEHCNKNETLCRFTFKLPHGSIRMAWYFAHRGRTSTLTRAQITGGTGQYAGATGHASVTALGPGGTVTRTLSGAQYIQVVFHLG